MSYGIYYQLSAAWSKVSQGMETYGRCGMWSTGKIRPVSKTLVYTHHEPDLLDMEYMASELP